MLRGMSEEARYRAAIDDHEKQIERFRRGEISAEELRPLRLAMGVYAQLAEVKHMQRIKIPGGAVSADQLDAIADVTERWGRGLAHVTTRQDFQLHYLELEDTVEVQRVLAERGVYTVGACADTVRNVTASPYAGVLDDELFDVTPYAHAITHYFAFHQHNRRLPRKFKIGLTGSAQDHAQVMINDLGFFAAETDRGQGFRVYIAGGLGSTPEIAHLWRDFVPARDALAAAEAVLNVFWRDGERKNRKKARIKFLLRKLGEAELLKRLDEELARILAEKGDALASTLEQLLSEHSEPAPRAAGQTPVSIGDGAFARFKRTNTIAQKQPGYRAVTVKLPLGDVTAPQIRAIASMARAHGNGEVRLTNTQNIVLRWVPEDHLVALHRALGEVSLAEADADHITDVVTCPGGDYCTLAITRSMFLASSIRDDLAGAVSRTEQEDLIRAVGPFAIKISGCFNACGQHHVADIGMTGLMVTGADGVERPHYSLRVGGGVGPGARLGERLDGRIPEDQTPKLVSAIARYYVAERGEGESFRDFVARVGPEAIGRAGFSAVTGVI